MTKRKYSRRGGEVKSPHGRDFFATGDPRPLLRPLPPFNNLEAEETVNDFPNLAK